MSTAAAASAARAPRSATAAARHGHGGLVAGLLGAVRAGQFERRPLRAGREVRPGGAVGLLGVPLGRLAGLQAGPGRRYVGVQLAGAVRYPQRGQDVRLPAQLPLPLAGGL